MVILGILSLTLPSKGWRSALYPEDWVPPESASFANEKLIQDFSYAGYRRGGEEIPEVNGPVFDVVESFGADATGIVDGTVAIQAAIDAASQVSGGVVFLPAGRYRISPQGGNQFALRIQESNLVLRGAGVGKTFLLNNAHQMRGKAIIFIKAPATTVGTSVLITEDLDEPTRRLPVADASAFGVGDRLRLEWDFTDGWISDHQQGAWWNATTKAPGPAGYLREVVAVNHAEGWIEVDVPTRYTVKTRDGARVRKILGELSGIGLEDFSIGNTEHPGSGWGEIDYQIEGRAAYDVDHSWLISVADTYDSWVARVASFQQDRNGSNCHLLSNGIRLLRCSRMTITNCVMRRSQYGGGGGNGYLFRIQSSQEILLRDSIAEFSRHGFVLSHAGTSGNVFFAV